MHVAGSITAFVAQWFIVIPALLVVASVALRKRWKLDGLEAASAAALTVALVKLAAAVRAEPRPFIVEHAHPLVAHAPDNAFPSDHLAACGLAFVYLWTRDKRMAAVALLAAALIAAARVLAKLHWPVDVAVGFALGSLGATAARIVSKAQELRAD
ncbi:MAG: phosphatase PAP2 family protein [Candidatus Baltobacteraceae bacterium]